MTWAEFQIRSFAFHRQEVEQWKKVREIAYTSLIAPYQDPKKIPRSREKYLPLGTKPKRNISDKAKIRFLEATKEYLERKKAKNG